MKYCSYFQASVSKKDTWFLTATLRSYEHLCFDRTLDVQNGLFEFFVPEANEVRFLDVMRYYQAIGLVTELVKLPNRLMTESL